VIILLTFDLHLLFLVDNSTDCLLLILTAFYSALFLHLLFNGSINQYIDLNFTQLLKWSSDHSIYPTPLFCTYCLFDLGDNSTDLWCSPISYLFHLPFVFAQIGFSSHLLIPTLTFIAFVNLFFVLEQHYRL